MEFGGRMGCGQPGPSERCPVGSGEAEPGGPTEGDRVGRETSSGAGTGGGPGLTPRRSWWLSGEGDSDGRVREEQTSSPF